MPNATVQMIHTAEANSQNVHPNPILDNDTNPTLDDVNPTPDEDVDMEDSLSVVLYRGPRPEEQNVRQFPESAKINN